MNEEIQKAAEIIKSGGIILYPTDTVWGIGCDATNAEAVQKIYDLKNRADSKSMICLVSDERMLENHVETVPAPAYDILAYAVKPTTIIFDQPKGIATNLIATDNSLGIRIPDDDFCMKLIRRLRKPIVSTSANISGHPTPKSFDEIDRNILEGVDYVVNLHREKKSGSPSTIIKLRNNGEVKVIRN